MNKSIFVSLLFLLFAVQFFVPLKMIYQQENALATGVAYKFKTQPIDPSDPFRGKFIVLNFEMSSFETTDDGWEKYNGNIFVYLKTDADGFATVKTVSRTLLENSGDYIIAKSSYNYDKTINFDLPFDRFYMNENKAYDAEVSVRNAQRDTAKICYGLVYVKNGTAVLDNVFIENTPIQQYVEDFQKEER